MKHPTAIFPNDTYLNGLRDADPTVIDALYNEFLQPVARAVQSSGGNYADGSTFFRVALIQTACLLHAGKYPESAPVYLYLKNLAVAQYRDWLYEKGQELPSLPEPTEEEIPILQTLPGEPQLAEMRHQIRAKRQFERLSPEDQKQIQRLANILSEKGNEALSVETGAYSGSILHFKKLLNAQDQSWEKALPDWVVFPLTNAHFHQIWSACEAMERRIHSSQIPTTGENKTFRYAFIAFVLLTLGYAAYTWFSRDQTPAEVYQNNFQPPSSILEDMDVRYSKDTIATIRPEACTIAFQQADEFYKKKAWREAAGILVGIMDDTLSRCQSDALFYLAIVGLQLDEPELTLECISKIEDLDRFGEDIYWYMALAYVKIAALEPTEKDIARRAVKRALSNTEIPERRVQAEKMLEELGK